MGRGVRMVEPQNDEGRRGEVEGPEDRGVAGPVPGGPAVEARERRGIEDGEAGVVAEVALEGRRVRRDAGGSGRAERLRELGEGQGDPSAVGEDGGGAVEGRVGHVASGSLGLHHAGADRALEWRDASPSG